MQIHHRIRKSLSPTPQAAHHSEKSWQPIDFENSQLSRAHIPTLTYIRESYCALKLHRVVAILRGGRRRAVTLSPVARRTRARARAHHAVMSHRISGIRIERILPRKNKSFSNIT